MPKMPWVKKGGSGLWTEYENKDTGESSIKTHKPRVVKQWCAKGQHDYRIIDMSKRLAECRKCSHETTFIIGKCDIDGDKITLH